MRIGVRADHDADIEAASAAAIREYIASLDKRSAEENLELFEKMRAGEFEDGSRTLRAIIDMASPNINNKR